MKRFNRHGLDRIDRLNGVNPVLVAALVLASGYFKVRTGGAYFVRVTDGLRTRERQAQLLAEGKSRTMNSKHLVGDAVDVAVMNAHDGSANWDFDLYVMFNECVQAAADEVDASIYWGGWWDRLRDGCHFQCDDPTRADLG